MARRWILATGFSILCASAAPAAAAMLSGPQPGDGALDGCCPEADRAPTRQASAGIDDADPKAGLDLVGSRSGPSQAASTPHSFDFWQETEPLSFPTRTADAICADLDGDGAPELIRLGIAFGDPHAGTLGVSFGGAYGIQGAEQCLQLLPSPRSVIAVDVNADGRLDLVAAHLKPVPHTVNQFLRSATFFIQTAAPAGRGIEFLNPAPSVTLAPGGEIVLLADVDRDQQADLVSVGSGHQLYYQRGLGLAPGSPAVPLFDAQFVSVSQLAAQTAGLPAGSSFSFGFANDLASGDFDGDGSIDLAVAAGSLLGGGTHLYYQRSEGWVYQGFTTPVVGSAGTHSITSLAVGDFNGDGLEDLVATSPLLDLATLLNSGSSSGFTTPAGMTPVTSPGVGRNCTFAVSADFDGDSHADVGFFDVMQQKLAVAYNPSTSSTPGVFLDQPAFLGAFDLQGSAPCAIEAADVDGDGDVDLVGSFVLSQSTAVLHCQRLANARKPCSVARLRGGEAAAALADAFVPDGLEYTQVPGAGTPSHVAADAFSFQASAAPGDSLRLRIHMRAAAPGVEARLGLLERSTNHVHWVQDLALTPLAQEFVVLVPDAERFISAAQRLQLCVMSSGRERSFRAAIDQLSAEVLR